MPTKNTMPDLDQTWLLLQLTDSSFPAGAFAHSSGLEAAWQLGDIPGPRELAQFLGSALRQVATYSAPIMIAVCTNPGRLKELDLFCDASITNVVANEASRSQGQALLAATARVFKIEALAEYERQFRKDHGPCHFAVAFGAVHAALAIEPEKAIHSFLFVTLRGLISAAVRLGIVGPLEGQAIQFELSRQSPKWIAACMAICNVEEICQSSPMMDYYQALQNRLYSRLFVS